MIEDKIKEMLKDIIDNGTEYECRDTSCIMSLSNITKDICNKCKMCQGERLWKPYKLGEAIHENFEYRKKEKWCVIKIECCPDYIITLKNEHNKNELYFESYQKEECEKWVEKHTKKTWLEEICENMKKIILKKNLNISTILQNMKLKKFAKRY